MIGHHNDKYLAHLQLQYLEDYGLSTGFLIRTFLEKKNIGPVLHMGNLKSIPLDRYDTEGVWFLEF